MYRIPPGAAAGSEPQLVVPRDTFDRPNGLCFSPDESVLYVNDTDQKNIHAFPVNDDGTLGSGRVFASGISKEFRAGGGRPICA